MPTLLYEDFVKFPITNQGKAQLKPILGVGTNDAEYSTHYTVEGKRYACLVYNTWMGILTRCYNQNYLARRPSYKGCSVCADWLIFSNFNQWFIENYIPGLVVDKDLRIIGNKIYGPDTCAFISKDLNGFSTHKKSSQGLLPCGVTADGIRFRSRVNFAGKSINIGTYGTSEEASNAYLLKKIALLDTFYIEESQDVVREGIRTWQKHLKSQFKK